MKVKVKVFLKHTWRDTGTKPSIEFEIMIAVIPRTGEYIIHEGIDYEVKRVSHDADNGCILINCKEA